MTIQQLENRLARYLHGTTIDQITNVYDLIYDSAQQVLLDIDPQETKRYSQIALFNSVFDYPSPDDLKGNGLIDIAPQVNRQFSDYYRQTFNQDFDLAKLTDLRDSFTVKFDTGSKSLRINAPTLPAPNQLNQASDIQNNGTWSPDGITGTNLTANNTNFVSGGGSLQFDIANGGYLLNTTSGKVDISAMLNQGSLFCYVYLPTGSQFTSVSLTWGSSMTDFYAVTVTTNQEGKAFQNGWNLLQFPWLGATVGGTPDPTSITTLQVTFVATAPQTGVLLNNIFAGMPLLCNLEYYSKYLFSDSSGAFKEIPSDPSDTINLDTETFNILVYQCGYQLAQQQQGVDALFYDANYFNLKYEAGVERYQALYKSEKTLPTANYYILPKRGYNGTINTNTFWGN